jgi:hypothetical protein
MSRPRGAVGAGRSPAGALGSSGDGALQSCRGEKAVYISSPVLHGSAESLGGQLIWVTLQGPADGRGHQRPWDRPQRGLSNREASIRSRMHAYALPHPPRAMLRQTSACGGCGSDHALFGQRLNLLGRHPQQLAVRGMVVLAIAGGATGVTDCRVPCTVVSDLHTVHEADALGRRVWPFHAHPGVFCDRLLSGLKIALG